MAINLTADEKLIKEEVFTTNLMFFWLKTNFSLTSKRIMGQDPNTLLGLIPLGTKEFTYPLKNVSSVEISTKFHVGRFLLGIILLPVSLSIISSSPFLGILLLVITVLAIVNCYKTVFSISNNGGQGLIMELSIIEKSKIEFYAGLVNNKIAEL